MQPSSSKEAILKKIRKALTASTSLPFPQSEGTGSIYQPSQKELEVQFAEAFVKLDGKFAFCLDATDLGVQITALAHAKGWTKFFCNEPAVRTLLGNSLPGSMYTTVLEDCDASITGCENLVARTGSIVISPASNAGGGRTPSVYAPVHICVAFTKQLVYDIREALLQLRKRYGDKLPSVISLATGPSRTADIEKTLVTGVHGPQEVYLFLMD